MTPFDFPTPLPWLNSAPLRLAHELQNRVILLHFFAHTCIHSLNTLPDLAHLQKKFADRPFQIVGIHVAKYESDERAIRAAIQRRQITHPILIDKNHEIWTHFHITSWPTFLLLAPDATLIGSISGEGHRNLLETAIDRTLAKSNPPPSDTRSSDTRSSDTRPSEPRPLGSDRASAPHPFPAPITNYQLPITNYPLAFPTKILADPARQRLIILDSLHHRILLTRWPDAHGNTPVQHIIGNGQPALTDGDFSTAAFHAPEGAALSTGRAGGADILWIADTANHAVRRIDLDKQQVATVLGNGEREFDNEAGKTGRAQPLNSPRDLALFANRLYISNAGQHQIFAMNLMTGLAEVAAGTARESLRDADALRATLAQPSGLALDAARQILYFTDAENSAIRALDLRAKKVTTLIGQGMFDFGDLDGPLPEARLQHPLGITLIHNATQLLIADTGNHKIKRLDLEQKHITTIPTDNMQLFEPTSIAATDADAAEIFISDTNNHRILRYCPPTGAWTPLNLRGL